MAKEEKLKVLKKTTEEKSAKKAFQEWMDHVRKKRNERTNQVQKRKEKFTHQMQWDPGGLISEIQSSYFQDHRVLYHSDCSRSL
jgi:hypothetical protein